MVKRNQLNLQCATKNLHEQTEKMVKFAATTIGLSVSRGLKYNILITA